MELQVNYILDDGRAEVSFTVENKNGEFSYIFKSRDRGQRGCEATFTKDDFHDLSEFFTRSMEAIGDVE